MATRENVERMLGKSLPKAKTFRNDRPFAAYNAAVRFCCGRGYSIGKTQQGAPTGIKQGDWDIQKWRSLSSSDQKIMDGVIAGDVRNGPVTVFYEASPLEQLAEVAE